MVAASAALTLSGAPFMGPIGAARVGFINNEYVLNPHARRDGGKPARPRGRRHPGRGADGRVGGQGAERGSDARRRDVRPPAFPAGDRRDHQARRESGEGAARAQRGGQCGAREGDARPGRAGSARRLRDPGEDGAPQRGRCRQGQGRWRITCPRASRTRRIPKQQRGRRVQGARSQDRALEHPRYRQAHRRPRREDRAPDRLRGRRAAARPRLGAVHARRDPGAGGGHAGHRRGRAVHRRAAGHVQGDVPAALQLPAVLGRRDRTLGAPRPPRDRPRQARLARGPSGAAGTRRVSLHDPRGLGDHRIERLILDGDRLRRFAGADGRGRAAEAADRPASPWA